jgi:hypothetical protein
MGAQREPTQLCKDTTVWERGPGSIKKLELIDSSKESRLEGSEEFSSSPVPLLSLLSSKQHSELWRLRTHSVSESWKGEEPSHPAWKALSLLHTLIHSHLEFRFQPKVSTFRNLTIPAHTDDRDGYTQNTLRDLPWWYKKKGQLNSDHRRWEEWSRRLQWFSQGEDGCAAYEKAWQWKAVCLYTLAYIGTRGLAPREEGSCYGQTVTG